MPLSKKQLKQIDEVQGRCEITCKFMNILDEDKDKECRERCKENNKRFLNFANQTDYLVFISLALLLLSIWWFLH